MNRREPRTHRRRRRLVLALIGTAVVLVVAAGGLALYLGSSTHYADTGRRLTVRTATVPRLGTVLVTGSGKPLYTYAPDKGRAATCRGFCTLDWPVVGVRSANDIVAGPGVDPGELRTIHDSGSLRAVTYHGRRLYTFASDRAATGFGGQGKHAYGGHWYAIRSSGAIVKATRP